MKYRCAYCGKKADKPSGEVNRARRIGFNLYCNRRCSGLGRRTGKTKAQRVEEKRIYDMEYRLKNSDMLKEKKHAYHLRTYDPKQAAIIRKKRMPKHVEYCRQPWYKEWKREYDRKRRAGEFGAFADAYTLTLELIKEIKRRDRNEQVKYENGVTNKAQRRRREGQRQERRSGHSPAHG